jgi:hypothetical protein
MSKEDFNPASWGCSNFPVPSIPGRKIKRGRFSCEASTLRSLRPLIVLAMR